MKSKTIFAKENNDRLDRFLCAKFPEYSRSYFSNLIKAGQILVDNNKAKASQNIVKDQKIEISFPEKEFLQAEKGNLDIVFENENVIVINKKAGISMHPGAGETTGTLASLLLNYYPDIKNVGEPDRPGIVHRLDKDTSGLVIVAKNNEARNYLFEQFKNRNVTKEYLALVNGIMKDSVGEINKAIKRSKSNRTKMAISIFGKEAVTKYSVQNFYNNYTLVKCWPRTGRTHQIRVHLESIGYPIVGDKVYGAKKQKHPFKTERQFLHAKKLKLELPSGETKEWETELPNDLQNILNKLENAK
ncbi:MAG: RluA family pseudouridine synthase [bacterium]